MDRHLDPMNEEFKRRLLAFEEEPSDWLWGEISDDVRWSQVFQQHFEGFSSEPSPSLWKGIEPRIIRPWWQQGLYQRIAAAGVALLLLVGGSVYMVNEKNTILNTHTAHRETTAALSSKAIENSYGSANTTNRRTTTPTAALVVIEKNNREISIPNAPPARTIKRVTVGLNPKNEVAFIAPGIDEKNLGANKGIEPVKNNEATERGSQIIDEFWVEKSKVAPITPPEGVAQNQAITKANAPGIVVVSSNIEPGITDKLSVQNLLGRNSLQLVNGLTKPLVNYQLPIFTTIKPKPLAKNSLEVFGSYMPMFSYYNILPYSKDNVIVQNVQTAKKLSAERLGYRIQLGVKVPLTKQLSMRASLVQMRLHQRLSFETKTPEDQLIASQPIYEVVEHQSDIQWQCVGLKLDAVYTLASSQRTAHYITLGRELNMRFVDETKRLNGFLNVSYGMSQTVAKGLKFWVEPTLNYSLKGKADEKQYLSVRPTNVGLNFGISKQL